MAKVEGGLYGVACPLAYLNLKEEYSVRSDWVVEAQEIEPGSSLV
jgi:hypothetical protein